MSNHQNHQKLGLAKALFHMADNLVQGAQPAAVSGKMCGRDRIQNKLETLKAFAYRDENDQTDEYSIKI